jgi:hypothetical protein
VLDVLFGGQRGLGIRELQFSKKKNIKFFSCNFFQILAIKTVDLDLDPDPSAVDLDLDPDPSVVDPDQ